MKEDLSLKVYWGSRRSNIDDSSKIIKDFLIILKGLSSYFDTWFIPGRSRRGSLLNKLVVEESDIKKLLLKSYKKELDENGFSENSFRLGFYNEDIHENAIGVSFCLDANSRYYCNLCIVSFNDEAGFSKNFIIDLFKLMISYFDAEWGSIVTDSLDLEFNHNQVGWVSYPKKSIKPITKFTHLTCEKFNKHGFIYYLKTGDKIFDKNYYDEINKLNSLILKMSK